MKNTVYLVENFDYEMRNDNPIPITQIFNKYEDAQTFYQQQLKAIKDDYTEMTQDGFDRVAIGTDKKHKNVTDIVYLRKLEVR